MSRGSGRRCCCSAFAQALFGTVEQVGDRLRYTPSATGVDTFTGTVSDGRGGTATPAVTDLTF